MISPAVTQSQMVEKLAEAGRAITRGPHGKALLLEIRLGGHLAALKYNSYLNAKAKQFHCHFAVDLVLVCRFWVLGVRQRHVLWSESSAAAAPVSVLSVATLLRSMCEWVDLSPAPKVNVPITWCLALG